MKRERAGLAVEYRIGRWSDRSPKLGRSRTGSALPHFTFRAGQGIPFNARFPGQDTRRVAGIIGRASGRALAWCDLATDVCERSEAKPGSVTPIEDSTGTSVTPQG